MRKHSILQFVSCLIFVILLLGRVRVFAAENERRIEEEKRVALEETELGILKGESRLLFDYGFWLNYRYDDYHDDDNDKETKDLLSYSNSIDSRFWMKLVLKPPVGAAHENEHSVYVRIKDLRIQRKPDDTGGGTDHDGPHLDYGYLTFDLRPWWFEVGRQYFSVGRGIAYSDVNDGAQIFYIFPRSKIKAFFSHMLPHEDNVDLSVPGYDKGSDRYFYGLEYTYAGIPNHRLFGYYIVQRDYSNEIPIDGANDYTYDSEYLGIGAQGKIFTNTNYWAEVIRETGTSRVYTTLQKLDVDAWAGDFGISYDWQAYTHPTLSLGYAFGSGDSDRASVTNTQNGNADGDDENFLYFGYFSTGYALAPRLSNLHFYKLGLSFTPFEKHKILKNCRFGIDYYRYYKFASGGGIYDLDATQANNDIGSEIDVNINWQIYSDLSCTLQYGHFQPEDAFPGSTGDSEDYFSLSLSLTF
ncbi:alginate export family protein [Candidatus Omnitrophota bacterium]